MRAGRGCCGFMCGNGVSVLSKLLMILLLPILINGTARGQTEFDSAVDWLLLQQDAAGYWGIYDEENEASVTALRDTMRVVEALLESDNPGAVAALNAAKTWVTDYEPLTTDDIARKIIILNSEGVRSCDSLLWDE